MDKEHLPSSIWRLILSKPASGAWNMAVDEAILEAATRCVVPPTLRLYDWDPPCLSLGYAQPISDVDLTRLDARGWDLVRRPTGGRAILHTDELTYSVCGPDTEPVLSGDIISSYQRLSSAILNALEEVGLAVQALPQKKPVSGIEPEPVCFEVPSNYEITVNGKKLVGSAQSRRRGGVLQHGTLPLTGDLSRIVQVLVFPDEGARQTAGERLLSRAATVQSALGAVVSWNQASETFSTAFGHMLNLNLKIGNLTAEEITRAEELIAEKYGNLEWNHRI